MTSIFPAKSDNQTTDNSHKINASFNTDKPNRRSRRVYSVSNSKFFYKTEGWRVKDEGRMMAGDGWGRRWGGIP